MHGSFSSGQIAKHAVLGFDELRVALPLSFVRRVVRAVHLTPLPGAPEIVLGMMDTGEEIVPAVNMRRRFHLPDRDMALTDLIVIAHTRLRPVALVADAVHGIFEYAEPDIANADTVLPGLEYVDGVVRLDDGLVLIHNLDRFLSLDEAASLDSAIATNAGV